MSQPDIYSASYGMDPYSAYTRMRRDYPVMRDPVSGRYLVSRHADVADILDGGRFSTRAYIETVEPVYGVTAMQLDGREHVRHRKFITPLLHGVRLRERLEPAVHRVARKLVSRFADKGEVDLVESFTTWYGVGVVADALGLGEAEEAVIRKVYTPIVAFQFNNDNNPAIHAEGLAAAREARDFLDDVLAERRVRPGDDLISDLLAARHGDDRFSDEEIVSFCVLMLVAGSETTDKVTASMIRNLIDHPDQFAAVRADRSLIDRVFSETLRYTPPVHLLLRTAEHDVAYSGHAIPAGSEVLCVLGAANRDETVFDRPDSFDIHRNDNNVQKAFIASADHYAFGFGRHFCIGSRLAQIEARVSMNLLFDTMADLRFADGFVPQEIGFWSRALPKLELRFQPTGALN
jgi:pulcherriminic acid synthase